MIVFIDNEIKWEEITDKMIKEIKKNLNICLDMETDFSSSTKDDIVAGNIITMDTFKSYFKSLQIFLYLQTL